MDAAKRKEIAAAWKSRRPSMGVFAVTCAATGDVFLGTAVDTDRAMNGVRARLDGGLHRCKQLQALWNERGAEGFEYEVVELLEYDDFRVELQRYAQVHPGLLKDLPSGLCAVARIPEELKDDVEPGILFCLRQNDEPRDPKDTNPTFPFYVIYVTNDGSVTTSHTQPKNALDIMRAACDGQREPLLGFCRKFNRATKDGTDMRCVNRLLQEAVSDITGMRESTGVASLFDTGEVGGGAALGFDDYSIVSFVALYR